MILIMIKVNDNARPHVAALVKTYLETIKWEVLPHSPYSPDIARMLPERWEKVVATDGQYVA